MKRPPTPAPTRPGNGVSDLATRWQGEAAELGWTRRRLVTEIDAAGRERRPADRFRWSPSSRSSISSRLPGRRGHGPTSCERSVTCNRPLSPMTGQRWAAALERACDQVIDHCVDLDPPPSRVRRRASDGRSIWLEPIAAHFTSDTILAEEERVLAWAMDAQADEPEPSTTDRPGRARRAPGRRRGCGRRCRPSGPRRRPGRHRQDDHARARRRRPGRVGPPGVRCRPDRQGGPCP